MTVLIVGLIVFHAIHLVPINRGMRDGVVERFGEGTYKGVFSLVSLIGLALIVWGKSTAEFVDLYDPPAWGRATTMILVLLEHFLIIPDRTLRH